MVNKFPLKGQIAKPLMICRKIYKRAGQALNLNLSQNCDSSFLLEKNSRISYFKCDAFDWEQSVNRTEQKIQIFKNLY